MWLIERLTSFTRASKPRVNYVSDGADWVLDEIAKSLQVVLGGDIFRIVKTARGITSGILHFSTVYFLPQILKRYDPRVKYVLTFFHISEDHISSVELLVQNQDKIQTIHTSCLITKKQLIQYGIEAKKIVVVPIGIDLQPFESARKISQKEAREKLGLPLDASIIGSFQKDGNGWDKGDEPKLVKGPDILCDVLEKIHDKKPILALLTGPARGYVKNRLSSAGIPFEHKLLPNYKDITWYYRALDVYLITSRVEGGPRAVMEAMASGVPLVSTAVGQAPEIIIHGENGFLAEVENVSKLSESVLQLLEHPEFVSKFTAAGFESVKSYDYGRLAPRYYEEIYSPLF